MNKAAIDKLRELIERSKGDNGMDACLELHRILFPTALPALLDEAEAAERLRQSCELCRHQDAKARAKLEAENERLKKELQDAQDVIDTHNELIDYLKYLLREIVVKNPVFERTSRSEIQVSNAILKETREFLEEAEIKQLQRYKAVWDALRTRISCDSVNATDPDADGYETLQKVKQALAAVEEEE